MSTRESVHQEAIKTLKELFKDYGAQGLVSIYFWGSIIGPDFNPISSDIDSVGLLSDEADFEQLDKIRDWLPKANPKLTRLQINFFFITELSREKPIRSRLARLATPEQAVFDFPHWEYVCGRRLDSDYFKPVFVRQYIQDQFKIVAERTIWAQNPTNPMYPEYYCKSLAWLCYAIHRQTYPKQPFSWRMLVAESNVDTLALISLLCHLKESNWDKRQVIRHLPHLYAMAEVLKQKYSD